MALEPSLTPERVRPGVRLLGLLPGKGVMVEHVRFLGETLQVTYRDPDGQLGEALLYPEDLALLQVEEAPRFPLDAPGDLFRLAAEAKRIRLAYLFDPMMAVHASLVEPLPHQIEAVYGHLLPKTPLRFLLADDPGAGKTIMAGLYIREMALRGALERCLVVAPGALVLQWQEELWEKFRLDFRVFSRFTLETSQGNPFREHPLWIARMDGLARFPEVAAKALEVDWDLVVVDEAHKMAASYYGQEVKATRRYRLGQELSQRAKHFLLLTATPHRGKEEDFRLFLALLDPDRFLGKPRPNSPPPDAQGLWLRRQKEDLVRFDGTPLFPERRAYTVAYSLSPEEMGLYEAVTDYVREEMNRAEALEEGQRRTVGFALTLLQRRLASSPLAIYRSLERRRKRLEARREEVRRGLLAFPTLEEEDIEEKEEFPDEELEAAPEVLDQATAARTLSELEAEIATLRRLEAQAKALLRGQQDRKWQELQTLLEDKRIRGRKLIVFTEHKDTLDYLESRLQAYLGRPEQVVAIHGGLSREERRLRQARFTQDREVLILVATDAAGEGVNLQQAHLLINYDLPWNPARLEQRFGRIHRIGQTEVCHMWNLVAENTRKGEVYLRLLRKLEEASQALGGRVFDVLGRLFQERSLKELLLEAIRYGEDPQVRARLFRQVEGAVDRERLEKLLQNALAAEVLDPKRLEALRLDMERAEARRLQPHYLGSFFREALEALGGTAYLREEGRMEVSFVPAKVREARPGVLRSYTRVTFHKGKVSLPGKPVADFLVPGHPLLEGVLDAVLREWGHNLERGTVLVDENATTPRLLLALEHEVRDAHGPVSRRFLYLSLSPKGEVREEGPAPYLDLRPATEEERAEAFGLWEGWDTAGLLAQAEAYATARLAKEHLEEVRRFRQAEVDRTLRAVRERLLSEIYHWDSLAAREEERAKAGKTGASGRAEAARRRADELRERLKRRERELEAARHLQSLPPRLSQAILVVPPLTPKVEAPELEAQRRLERLAVEAVLLAERRLGHEPKEMPPGWPGYDVESRTLQGTLRFIEVKGKGPGSEVVTLSRTQILTALNKPTSWFLAVVETDGEKALRVHYIPTPFVREPDFGATSVNYDLKELLAKAKQVVVL
ncbi:helicase [Thermus scotoductus]|uniref:Helicase n=1 Tax=Thermus scotoductus TaxID=37636 RepID=A0A430SCW6_THESC|nr:helicase-related protein [Thermus scotoductus]RTG97369.1 helicase [Thermus scotoductus]RTH12356.1 helicase [Thermus scotoductus]RTH13314.1 helicase [Thermus scotoductus]RTH14109.1 helicase [Thermus scotoductus]RTH30142.1 helicase [Thermus scotoductus]